MYWLSELARSKRDFDNGRRHTRHSCSQWWWIGRKGRDSTKFLPCCMRCTGWKKKERGREKKKRNRNNESKGQMSCQISETANCCEQSREYRWKGVARPLYLAAMLLFNLRPSLVISVSACVLHPWIQIPKIFRLTYSLSFPFIFF